MLYSLFRPLLFSLDPETAHCVTFNAIEKASRLGLLPGRPFACQSRNVMGLDFPNPVGLAAGLDKDGEHIDALAALGFGFIEIGTVTPRPQPGNPQPRLFRLPQANAIINRLGFNNHGVDKLVVNVKRSHYRGILGINIGKNFDTPVARAADDYLDCLRKVYAYASYVVVNISSPNTLNLRQLQNSAELDHLLDALKAEQKKLADQHGRYTPLAVKIAPDLEPPQIEAIAALLMQHRIDGIINLDASSGTSPFRKTAYPGICVEKRRYALHQFHRGYASRRRIETKSPEQLARGALVSGCARRALEDRSSLQAHRS